MKKLAFGFLSCLLLAVLGPVVGNAGETAAVPEAGTAAAPAPAPPLGSGATADVESLMQLLQSKYVDPSRVNDVELSRAAVEGIVAALVPGAEWVVAEEGSVSRTNEPPVVHAEMVGPLIGYVRLHRLEEPAVSELDAALRRFDEQTIDSLVLDLRFLRGGSFEAAREVASRFLPADKPLYHLQGARPEAARAYHSNQPSAYLDWRLVVLVNAGTAGAAEAVAGALRDQARALVLGVPTAGKAVEWSEEVLPSGRRVRLATHKVVLASGADLFPQGVKPDVTVAADADGERKILFEMSRERPLREFVEEAEVEQKLNEAALVRMLGQGASGESPQPRPEERKPVERKPPLPRDIALQRAVDILKGIRILRLE